ncbi:MAG: hypothetical protein WCA22_13425 [Candidatus Binatus sp.]
MPELGGHVGDGRTLGEQAARERVTQIVEAVPADPGEAQDPGEPLAAPALVEIAALCVYENQVGHVTPLLLERLRLAHAIERAERHGKLLAHVHLANRASLRRSDFAG